MILSQTILLFGLSLYQHPCGNGDPVVRFCPDGDVPHADPTFKACAELGLKVGDPCAAKLERCVLNPATACASDPTVVVNAAEYLWCRSEPFDPDTICPISTREAKRDISYLTAEDRAKLADQVLGLRLATYEYKPGLTPLRGQQLGFIIEDARDTPFVAPTGDRVNLYSYVSALVATVQAQQERIEKLEAQLGATP